VNINQLNQREPDLKSALLASAWAHWPGILIGLAILCLSASQGQGSEPRDEYEMKAAFIYNFTKFIEWPKNTLPDTNAPFVVGVAGGSLCTPPLEKLAKERKVSGRSLVIKVVQSPAAIQGVQVLFVPEAADARLKDWLTAAHGAGVLTIGESEPFFKKGGMINFFFEGEGIRFDLNIAQAEAAGLKVSAQLQKLARTVRKKLVD
jgi:hypothetical protein